MILSCLFLKSRFFFATLFYLLFPFHYFLASCSFFMQLFQNVYCLFLVPAAYCLLGICYKNNETEAEVNSATLKEETGAKRQETKIMNFEQ